MTQPRYQSSDTSTSGTPGPLVNTNRRVPSSRSSSQTMDPHVVIADTHHMTTSGGLSHLAAQAVQLGAASRSRVVAHLAPQLRHLVGGVFTRDATAWAAARAGRERGY
jgi:hypothetical protein